MEKQTYTPQWSRRSYTKEEFIDAWTSARSIADCAKKLGLSIYGTTNTTLKMTAKSLHLSSDHMTGQGWRSVDRETKCGTVAKPIEYYLTENGQMSSSNLKRRLLKEKILEYRCSAPYCANPETVIDGFTGEIVPTPLTLDHINGVNNDNRLENLRLICANCDRMNPTFCRGSGERDKKGLPNKTSTTCPGCGAIKYPRAYMCRPCSQILRKMSPSGKPKSWGDTPKTQLNKSKNRRSRKGVRTTPHKIEWPPTEELLLRLKTTSYVQLGKELGVSDNAIRKHIKNYPVTSCKRLDTD